MINSQTHQTSFNNPTNSLSRTLFLTKCQAFEYFDMRTVAIPLEGYLQMFQGKIIIIMIFLIPESTSCAKYTYTLFTPNVENLKAVKEV